MAALDSVFEDVGTQLGISNNSVGTLLSGLLSLIGKDAGGVSSFLVLLCQIRSDTCCSLSMRCK